jgi:hypothetical protein
VFSGLFFHRPWHLIPSAFASTGSAHDAVLLGGSQVVANDLLKRSRVIAVQVAESLLEEMLMGKRV